jgi:hypothetical protein
MDSLFGRATREIHVPWDHCDIEFILDDEQCPSCGTTKAQWTVQLDKTRTLRIGRKGPVARWSATLVDVGQEVELLVEPTRLDDEARCELVVYEHDQDGQHDEVARVEGVVQGGRLQACWRTRSVVDDDDWDARYERQAIQAPEFFFEAQVGRQPVRSGLEEAQLLRLRQRIEEVVRDSKGSPIPDLPWEVELPDGTLRQGVTDSAGTVLIEDAACGAYSLRLLEALPPARLSAPRQPWSASPARLPVRSTLVPGPEARGAWWSTVQAQAGETVQAIAQDPRLEAGRTYQVRVLEHDRDQQHDLIETLQVSAQAGRLSAAWTARDLLDADDEWDARYDRRPGGQPELFFEVALEGERLQSHLDDPSLLRIRTELVEVLRGPDDRPLAGLAWEVVLADGSVHQGSTDQSGRVVVADPCPGPYTLRLLDTPLPPALDETRP